MKNSDQKTNIVERPPVVVVMGHIDHGKSTLLDYIRKTKVVDGEAGGITQHVSAYETLYEIDGKKRRVTFLDTPGHEAFQTLRSRGTKVADVAILVVSAEDGVKKQTLEALNAIKEQDIPFVIAINKIDKAGANIDRTKQSLAENEVYVEGYGGTVTCIPISAKTGEGIEELINVVFLTTDVQELTGDTGLNATGIVIESKLDARKGISASLIIKNGMLRTGQFIAAGNSFATVRAIENDTGEKLNMASFSTPVMIVGWSELVPSGVEFVTCDLKDEAITYTKNFAANTVKVQKIGINSNQENKISTLNIIVKADTAGSLEAINYEIKKLGNDRIKPEIISEGVGAIGEGDVKSANASTKAFIFGFNTKADSAAKILAERDGISIEIFSIIYKITEKVEKLLTEHTPKMMVDEITGSAKILRTFSRQKDKQIIGGKVEEGFLSVGEAIRIIRRETEIGTGRIRGMQQQKKETAKVEAGNEFGAYVESKFEIAVGDVLRSYHTIEK